MTIVIPVCQFDIDQAQRMIEIMSKFEKLDRAVLVSTWRAGWDVDPHMEMLSKFCTVYEKVVLQSEFEYGWPEASNHLFYESAKYLDEVGNTEPWLFMEADMMPLVSNWCNRLQEEYDRAKMPYMGVISPTTYVNRETHERWIDGEHMVGAGIYPENFLSICTSIHTVDRFAWDVVIGPEIITQVHHTNLIAHRWNTCNYRYNNDGKIIMDDIPKEDVGPRAKPLPPETVLVHGVKDFSLYNLLSNATVLPS